MADELEWETERYAPVGNGTELATVVHQTGLLYMVNAAVLHPHGLALGVNVNESTGQVAGLNLHRTSDPQGIWFDEELTVMAREKMQAAGILLGAQEAYPERMAEIRKALDKLSELLGLLDDSGTVMEAGGILNALDLILRGDPGCVEPEEVPWAGKRKF